jgi:putative endonuclease
MEMLPFGLVFSLPAINLSTVTERWPSGLRHTPGKRTHLKRVSRVRISPSPPVFARSFAESEDCRAEAQRRRAIRLEQEFRATTRQARMNFHYVYILQNEYSRFYVGCTQDLKVRLKKHNAGEVPHTSKFRPWRVKTAIAFTNEEKAREFERYLKTSSGRAFAKKRL